jgi:hypothetical protein
VTIRNNTFRNTFFDSIKIYTNGKGAMAHNIRIEGNRITTWYTDPNASQSASAISVRNAVGVVIENNTIGKGAAKAAISKPISLQNCKEFVETGNRLPKETEDSLPHD